MQALPPFDRSVLSTSHHRREASRSLSPKSASRIEQVILGCWQDILGVEALSVQDNFFEVGGHSLLAAKMVGILTSKYGLNIAVLDLYDNPTVQSLARYLGKTSVQPTHTPPTSPRRGPRPSRAAASLAIVGMAGRFPSTVSVNALWEVLQNGTDTLRLFSAEELSRRNVPEEVRSHPDYVKAGQVVDDADKFDAGFWGIGKLEAQIMDPQHRMFMEVAWEAVESAGYGPRNGTPKSTGVFAAAGIDGYLIHHLEGGALKMPMDPGALFMTEVASEKDYIATRVSYAMDLHGPSMTINSACSSGLVAIAMAAQSIRARACEMAIAGASSLTFPNTGFLYEDGLVYSQDGHVRPFDRAANGTVFGDSVGAVVIKLGTDAAADGDRVLAVLDGSAVTNDGGVKAGYTAPTAAGQQAAIVAAMAAAGVTGRDISYVECHATATNIGDAIEIRGLRDAFATTTTDKTVGWCAIGSIKGNIGHANCAAGLTGFIKTVLCLQHRKLVPTAHFTNLNPKLSLDHTPFYVNEQLRSWDADGAVMRGPLRAGVSSFGIGGTNAHAVLSEWTAEQRAAQQLRGGAGRDVHVLTISAKTEASLRANLDSMAAHLEANLDADLTDLAYTLHTGRDEFEHRAAVAGSSTAGAAGALRKAATGGKRHPNPSVVFCFPGQGSQYLGMGQGLYDSEPVYRQNFVRCCTALAPMIGYDLRERLFAARATGEAERKAQDAAFNADAVLVQTSIFAVEYSMARLLIDTIGLEPIVLVGHSIGEYAAAVISEVLTLEGALGMVAARARAVRDLCAADGPSGMLSARMAVAEAREFAAENDGVWVACENSPNNVVFSGMLPILEEVKGELEQRGVRCTALHVSHGFHSPIVQPAADAVAAHAEGLEMAAPKVPMVSNVTGEWLDVDEITPEYWSRHVTGSVRFVENVQTVASWQPSIFVECGPGSTLSALVAKCYQDLSGSPAFAQTMRHPTAGDTTDQTMHATTVGQLWSHGIPVNWPAYHDGERMLRTPLPTYCFEKTSFWVNPSASIYADAAAELRRVPSARSTLAAHLAAPSPSASLVYYQQCKPSPTLKAYCFPYAGGSSQIFSGWAQDSPAWLEVVAVELAGRGGRAGDAQPATAAEDAAAVAVMAGHIRRDFAASAATGLALVGLSMGCLVALEVAAQLADLPVVHAFMAGRAPVGGVEDAGPEVALVSADGLNMASAEVLFSLFFFSC